MPSIGERVERRRECRLPVTLDGTFQAQDGRWTHEGIVEDLHRFGARAHIPHLELLAEGEPVFMELAVASAPDRVPGRVRWAEHCEEGGLRCGISFDEVLSLDLPLETVTAACARLQEESFSRGRQAASPLLEKAMTLLHGETWGGGIFRLMAEPAQHVFSTLRARLELEFLRLHKAMVEPRNASPEAMPHSVAAKSSGLLQELQAASAKIKECIACLRLLHSSLVLQPESFLYTVDPEEVIRRSITVVETLCAFLEGKMGTLRFLMQANGMPVLAVRPVDLRRAVDGCLLGLMESALHTDGSTLTVSAHAADGWIELRFGHNGFRMMQADELNISLKDNGLAGQTTPRDESTVLRFYHAVWPLKEYGASLYVRSESGRNRVHVRLPSEYIFAPGKLRPATTPSSHSARHCP